jgi:hypothetical protein
MGKEVGAMFDSECSQCGSGLRDRDRQCRLCRLDNPRFGGSSNPWGLASAPAHPEPAAGARLGPERDALATTTELVAAAAETASSFAAAALSAPPAGPEKRGRTRKVGR